MHKSLAVSCDLGTSDCLSASTTWSPDGYRPGLSHEVAPRASLAIAAQSPQIWRMSATCCDHEPSHDAHRGDPAFKRTLWVVLAINAIMFVIEVCAGLAAGSASLQADALDFLGDSANYAISLFVVGMPLRYRSMAALAKGATMGLFGLWVITAVVLHVIAGTMPEPATMGIVGLVALAANAICFWLLWSHRAGDANMRSVWVCSRNDVLGNLAVLLAALGVFGTNTGWPDYIVAATMAGLAVQGGVLVASHALQELHSAPTSRLRIPSH
jgi:Co/Zn/Cd efflux system component